MTDKLLDYFNGDDLAATVWLNKYALEGEETPDDMHKRLAAKFAEVELENRVMKHSAKYKSVYKNLSDLGKEIEYITEEEIYNLFKDFNYIVPQGSVMSQLGSKTIGSLSNCFVVGEPEDSYGGIMKLDEEQIQLMKRRGGVGIDLSTLRPEKTATTNAAKSSTGPVSFMPRFSNSTREVAQDGRRGALMLSLKIEHPDSLKFITVKRDLTKITGANISVKLNDTFMKAVENDEDYILRWPCTSELNVSKYDDWYPGWDDGKLNYIPKDDVYVKVIKAREYWDEIIKSAHNVAEPGLMFWDTMVNYSPDGVYSQYKPVTTNPCSEIAMQPYDACRLIAVNLFGFVVNPFTREAYFDFDKFYEVNYKAMRLSDDLVDLEVGHINRILNKISNDPEPADVKLREFKLWEKVSKTAIASRRTGLGVTAVADVLAALGIKYGSAESLDMITVISRTKMKSELDCTIDLAVLRGTFDGWDAKKELRGNEFYINLEKEFPDQFKRMQKFGRRNVSISTLAPTGTTSLMTQTSSGIEPVFMPFYTRRKKVNPNDKNTKVDFVDEVGDSWEEFQVLHPKFKDWMNKTWDYNEVMGDHTTKENLQIAFENSPWYKSTANDIDWIKRVEIQSIMQKYITHSISSTINLPNDVSEAEVGEIYMESWKKGLKGITVYRDGSRSGVLVNDDKNELTKFNDHHSPKRPKTVDAKLVRFNNNKEKWIAFVGIIDGKPYEVFTGLLDDIKIPAKIEEGKIVKVRADGKKRYDFTYGDEETVEGIDKIFNTSYWNYGKLISGMLRHGMPLHFAVEMINTLNFEEDHINTWKNGVARALKKFIPDGKAEGMKCNDCGSTNVIFEEGCSKCRDCGSSKCG